MKHVKQKKNKKYLLWGGILLLVLGIGVAFWKFWPWEYTKLNMRTDLTVSENILSSPENKIFANAIASAGYTTFLEGEGPFTVFLPTDKAYANLSPETRGALTDPENPGLSRQVLLYHVVKGRYLAADIKEGMTLETVQGELLHFSWKDGYLVINGYSYVEIPNVVSKNGIIHISTNYLLPPSILEENITNSGLYEVLPVQEVSPSQ